VKIGYFLIPDSHNNEYAAAVYILKDNQSPEETSAGLSSRFDCAATILALQDAIHHIQNGDGIGATGAAAEAFARLAFFHKT
jgi:hypothetical protein